MLHRTLTLHTIVTGFTCDRCSKEVEVDHLEYPEGHHIEFTTGYASVFGDGAKVECDFCQDCFHALVGQFCRINSFQ